ncbi:hypothetical protein DFH28DRAFT_877128, partial [Melampsora americana]
IGRLFPNSSSNSPKPLGILVQRLLDIFKAALVPKSKQSKTVNVDIESAANILVIAGLIQEQASIMEARRVVFDPNRQTAPTPTPSNLAPETQFEFRSETLSAKVESLADQVAKLVSTINPSQNQGPQPQQSGQRTGSYALAASKHAPKGAQAPNQSQKGRPAQPKQGAQPRTEASLTLVQQDPKNILGADKTIPDL